MLKNRFFLCLAISCAWLFLCVGELLPDQNDDPDVVSLAGHWIGTGSVTREVLPTHFDDLMIWISPGGLMIESQGIEYALQVTRPWGILIKNPNGLDLDRTFSLKKDIRILSKRLTWQPENQALVWTCRYELEGEKVVEEYIFRRNTEVKKYERRLNTLLGYWKLKTIEVGLDASLNPLSWIDLSYDYEDLAEIVKKEPLLKDYRELKVPVGFELCAPRGTRFYPWAKGELIFVHADRTHEVLGYHLNLRTLKISTLHPQVNMMLQGSCLLDEDQLCILHQREFGSYGAGHIEGFFQRVVLPPPFPKTFCSE